MDVYMGYSEVDITPDYPVELIGFSRPDNTSKGILHRLKAQVMVWKASKELCCLITIDSLGFTTELSNKLRKRIAKELQTSQDKVMVCFSHTHAAPNAGTDEKYYEFVYNGILSALSSAVLDLSEVNAAWGLGNSQIGINRRGNTELVDNRIGILEVTDRVSNKIKVLLLRVTAHANVLSSDNYLLSSDYFGVTRDLLKAKYGCEIMLVQGAAGDIRPKYQQENAEYLEIYSYESAQKEVTEDDRKKHFDQSICALDKMANQICKAVEKVIVEMTPKPIYRLAMYSAASHFAADVPTMEDAHIIAKEANQMVGIDGTSWLKEVKRLNDDNVKQQFVDIEIQYFCVNDGCICGIPNEAMCKISLDIMEKAENRLLLFGGYTNGCNSYLPTSEEYDKGGYEVFWSNLVYYQYHGRVMPLNRDTADKLVDDVVKHYVV